MRKLSIVLTIILLASLVSVSMISVYAEPSLPDGTEETTSVVTSTDTSSTVTDTETSSAESDVSDTSSEESSSEDAEEEVSSDAVSSASSEVTAVSSSQTSSAASSVVSKTPPPYEDEGYIYDIDDDEDYVQVTSDSLSQPTDWDMDGIDDAEEEKMDSRLSKRISRIIWIPILLAVASAAGLITINVLYRKKYGKLSSGKKNKKPKKNKKTNLYIPRD